MEYSSSIGMSSLLYIVIVLLCIGIAWWALQVFRFDVFIRNPKGTQGKLLQVLFSVALGYQIARFFIDYLNWSLLLKWIL